MEKNEESLREIWDTCKCMNILVLGVPEVSVERKKRKIIHIMVKPSQIH